MMWQMIAVCLWVVVAFVLAAFPSKDHHWRLAYALMAVGLPLLIWVWWTVGVWLAAAFMIVASLVFRWPLIYLFRWLRRILGAV